MTAIAPRPDLSPVVNDAATEPNTLVLLMGYADRSGTTKAPASKLYRTDGSKESRQPGYWRAIQLQISDPTSMETLLSMVGASSYAALCNARFPGLPVYHLSGLARTTNAIGIPEFFKAQGFRIWPQAAVKQRFGSAAGIYDDGQGPVVARISENTLPTSWLLIDQDLGPEAPNWATEDSVIDLLEAHFPGIGATPRVISPSSSARVQRDGVPIGSGHSHIWVQIQAATSEELTLARARIQGRLIAERQCWPVPDKNGRPQIRLPVDLSTWSPARLVFSGKPQVEAGSCLTVSAPELKSFDGVPASLAAIPEPDRHKFLAEQRALRPGYTVSLSKGARLNIDIYDLVVDMEIELDDGTMTSLEEVKEELISRRSAGDRNTKIRMQSPLRPESRSCAAFAGLAANRDVFIIDAGLPGETHWPTERPTDIFAPISGGIPPNATGTASLQIPSSCQFRLLSAQELAQQKPLRWIVKHVLPESGLAVLYGRSGAGKSFLTLDLAAAIAGGSDRWFEFKVETQPVTYCLLESETGVPKRVEAWSKHHGQPAPALLKFVTQPVDIRAQGVVENLAASILAVAGKGGMIILDTLARAAPGMDENSGQDMSHVIDAAGRLHQLTGGLVLLVAHSGKTDGRGPRGHSSLFAAADAVIEVRREGELRSWQLEKSKDDVDGSSFAFTLAGLKLGLDDDLEEIVSCAVLPATSQPRKKPLSAAQRLALSTLLEAINEVPVMSHEGMKGAHLNSWRPIYNRASTADKPETKRRTFARARDGLVDAGILRVVDDVYYRVEPECEDFL